MTPAAAEKSALNTAHPGPRSRRTRTDSKQGCTRHFDMAHPHHSCGGTATRFTAGIHYMRGGPAVKTRNNPIATDQLRRGELPLYSRNLQVPFSFWRTFQSPLFVVQMLPEVSSFSFLNSSPLVLLGWQARVHQAHSAHPNSQLVSAAVLQAAAGPGQCHSGKLKKELA